jgi:hypothetical protein
VKNTRQPQAEYMFLQQCHGDTSQLYTDDDAGFKAIAGRLEIPHDWCTHSGKLDPKTGVMRRFTKPGAPHVNTNGVEGYVHGVVKRHIAQHGTCTRDDGRLDNELSFVSVRLNLSNRTVASFFLVLLHAIEGMYSFYMDRPEPPIEFADFTNAYCADKIVGERGSMLKKLYFFGGTCWYVAVFIYRRQH